MPLSHFIFSERVSELVQSKMELSGLMFCSSNERERKLFTLLVSSAEILIALKSESTFALFCEKENKEQRRKIIEKRK